MFTAHIVFAIIFILGIVATTIGIIVENCSRYYDNQDIGVILAGGGLACFLCGVLGGIMFGLASQGSLKQYHQTYAITSLVSNEESFVIGIYTKGKVSYYVYRYEVNEHTYALAKKPITNCTIYETNNSDNRVVIDKQKYKVEEKVSIYVPIDYKCVVWEAI